MSLLHDWRNVHIQEAYLHLRLDARSTDFILKAVSSRVFAIRRLTSCSLLPSLGIYTPRFVKLVPHLVARGMYMYNIRAWLSADRLDLRLQPVNFHVKGCNLYNFNGHTLSIS